nr:MAG TPA: holin protein [Caudoviricetes sp.]
MDASYVLTAFLTGGVLSFIQFLISRKDTKDDKLKELEALIETNVKETREIGRKRFELHAETLKKLEACLDQLKENDTNQTEFLQRQAASLVGIGHDRILFLGNEYIKRGYITHDEYENLYDYLYIPYKKLGGNGTAEKVMREVDKLPLRDNKVTE